MTNGMEMDNTDNYNIITKNILLISMSTLPFNPVESYYKFQGKEEDKSYYFRGISQLEAGTKYFLRAMRDKEGTLDKIFIVESEASREKIKKGGNSGLYKLCENFPLPYRDETLSAVEFYKERIKQYIRGEETSWFDDDNTKNLREKVDSFDKRAPELLTAYKDLIGEGLGEGKLFEDIVLKDSENEQGEPDQDAIYNAIQSLCTGIKEICSVDHEKKTKITVGLYTDMQGARRYETFVINAAVKMLEMNDIKVLQSVATNFDSKNNSNGRFNFIVDATINDRIFEMVSGMNEFEKTGRGDTLVTFWDNSKDLLGLSSDEEEREKKVINSISDISDSISLCYASKFEDGLKCFKDAVLEYETAAENKQPGIHPLFETFIEDLKKDYSKEGLLDDPFEIEKEVRWCVRKGLYQQALTLIEAKAPEELVKDKYNGEGGTICYKNMDTLEQLLHFAYTHNYNNHHYENQCDNNKRSLLGKSGVPTYAFDHDYAVHPAYVFINYAIYWRKCDSGNGYIISLFGEYWSRDKGDPRTSLAKASKKNKLGKFLEEYNAVKDLRNKINHADPEAILNNNDDHDISINEHHNDTLIVNNNTSGNTEESSVTDSLKKTIEETIEDFFKSYNALANIQIDFSKKYPLSTWQNQ